MSVLEIGKRGEVRATVSLQIKDSLDYDNDCRQTVTDLCIAG
jgi:hypothetical protein